MTISEVKEYLKSVFDCHGIIEHTQVAQMCLSVHEHIKYSKIKKKFKAQDQFNDKCHYWLTGLGFSPIYKGGNEIHLVKDRIRVICVNDSEPYCKFSLDVLKGVPHTIIGMKMPLFDNEKLLSEFEKFKTLPPYVK